MIAWMVMAEAVPRKRAATVAGTAGSIIWDRVAHHPANSRLARIGVPGRRRAAAAMNPAAASTAVDSAISQPFPAESIRWPLSIDSATALNAR
jgi:hypothetical protein